MDKRNFPNVPSFCALFTKNKKREKKQRAQSEQSYK
jgi:hypothetical protein